MTASSERTFASTVSSVAAAAAGLLILAGCATAPDPSDAEAVAEYEQTNDPAEPFNRAVFTFNRGLDTMFLKPAAEFYRGLTPPFFQEGMHNFLNNLRTPVILANDLLQGETDRAWTTVARFAINTTLGVGGVRDPATDMGHEYHAEDFGQTLAVWGVDEGPYLMLPLLGPSNPRDAVGTVVDLFFDPFTYWSWADGDKGNYASGAKTAANAIDFRARNYDALEDLEKSSLDFYAAVRSLYRQRRGSEIRNGESLDDLPTPGLGQTPGPSFGISDDQVSTRSQ